MSATVSELEVWLSEPEAERREFNEAENNFYFESLAKYCAALAKRAAERLSLA